MDNTTLKEKVRKLDVSNIEFMNFINKASFSTLFESSSILHSNAGIDSFFGNNFQKLDKMTDENYVHKSIEVQDVINFDDTDSCDPRPLVELSVKRKNKSKIE